MTDTYVPCWRVLGCGREVGGALVDELGVCPTAEENMGHSCWVVAGTLCGGAVQGFFAQKPESCLTCEVFQLYHRTNGTLGPEIAVLFPEEQDRYQELIRSYCKLGAPGDSSDQDD